jgi:uncharacterized cupin superfamily protein
MPDTFTKKVRVIKPEDVVWEDAAVYPEEQDPPGRQLTAGRSLDERFSFGLWQRDVQQRYFERAYHEVAYILEGKVEITEDDGTVTIAGPGDILVTPMGSKGYWKNLTPVKKVWGIYEEAPSEIEAYKGPGAF